MRERVVNREYLRRYLSSLLIECRGYRTHPLPESQVPESINEVSRDFSTFLHLKSDVADLVHRYVSHKSVQSFPEITADITGSAAPVPGGRYNRNLAFFRASAIPTDFYINLLRDKYSLILIIYYTIFRFNFKSFYSILVVF